MAGYGKKYSLGVDFGTLSGRAVLVEVDTGTITATVAMDYPHGVMDEFLPDGKTRLEPDWALQHPQDYIDVLKYIVPAVLEQAGKGVDPKGVDPKGVDPKGVDPKGVDPKGVDPKGVDHDDIIGLGMDFTACTIIPIKKDGTPLCFIDKFRNNPHSYVKLWKHHASQPEANRLNEIAERRGEGFLKRYGGKISSEWLFPKVMQILDEAPEIFEAADKFIEATDWITLMLTGNERRNSCTAGYKAIWSKREGYPSNEFLKELDPRLENVIDEKLSRDIYSLGGKAGELTAEGARLTGLRQGTAVSVSNVDAHVAVPAVGIVEPGKMLMIMGTSTCHMVLGTEERIVPGMCGVVEDGIIPGFLGYEAGQSCVGDHFGWFVENCVPPAYHEEAKAKGIDMHTLLTEKAKALKPGESGLIALDWWNGNRSVLVDVDLTGVMLGCTLATKPEEIYRALVEATAYGTNMIIRTFEKSGVPIKELYACGGIAEKNEFIMQVYADVTDREIRISASPQTVALGSAMFGAVAAGREKGGYDSIFEAAKVMSKVKESYYKPNPANVAIYRKLYAEYEILHDYFGRGANDVMKRLKKIKEASVVSK